jgi:hypothetical protein
VQQATAHGRQPGVAALQHFLLTLTAMLSIHGLLLCICKHRSGLLGSMHAVEHLSRKKIGRTCQN